MLRITFDSAMWRLAAAPDRFPDQPDILSFRKINSAIAAGTLSATLPETIFTFEAIKASLQKRLERNRPLARKMGVTERPDGTVGLTRTPGAARPAESDPDAGLADGWAAARQLGFKILHCSRLAMTTNPSLASDWFVGDSYNIAKRFGACSREIGASGCGVGRWETLETKYPGIGQPWDGVATPVPAAEIDAIATAAAEWVDADTVAAHYAYGNDYICARDVDASDGVDCVLSAQSRTWLASKYGIKFVLPEEIVGMIDRVGA